MESCAGRRLQGVSVLCEISDAEFARQQARGGDKALRPTYVDAYNKSLDQSAVGFEAGDNCLLLRHGEAVYGTVVERSKKDGSYTVDMEDDEHSRRVGVFHLSPCSPTEHLLAAGSREAMHYADSRHKSTDFAHAFSTAAKVHSFASRLKKAVRHEVASKGLAHALMSASGLVQFITKTQAAVAQRKQRRRSISDPDKLGPVLQAAPREL